MLLNAGIVAASAASALAWTPADITTALWLDAADASTFTLDGALVSQWNDKSGNARHATATSTTRPTKSGDSVVFTSDRLVIPTAGAPAGGLAIIAVMASTSTATSATAGFINVETGGSFDPELRIGSNTDGNAIQHYYNGAYAINNLSAGTTTRGIVAIEHTGSTTATYFRDGTETSTGTLSGGFSAITGFNVGFIVTGSAYRNGTLEELIVYTSGTTDRQLLEGYLAHKWGLAASLPGGHPYKGAPP